MQFLRAVARQKLNALPHDKIIRAEFLEPFVGSAVFIKSVLSEAEEDRGGDGARPALGEDNETETGSDDMLVDVQEKRRRLRRETVTSARLNMKPVKIGDGRAIADNGRAHIAVFCFANGPADWTGEASGQFFGAAAQIECMPVKFRGGARGELKGLASPYFKVFPAAFLREANKAISYEAHRFLIKDERFARIAKWKADAAAARERTAHFHQRNQRGQSAPAGKLKIERLMVISLMKHLCPGTGVETIGIAMQSNNMVPTRIVDRIEDPHLQRFAGCLRLDERIIARERRSFFRSRFGWLKNLQEFSLGERSHANCFADAASDIFDLLFR